MLGQKGVLTVVSGFSGAGKGTAMKELLKKYPQYGLSISATTRKPRDGEVHGKEYFFLSVEEFEKLIAEDGFIEYAKYVDNYYGTPRTYVEDKLAAGQDVILEIEPQGALKVKAKYPDALLIFLTPPSGEELYRRLKGRGTETEDVVRARLARAVQETEYVSRYDYIAVNDKLEACVELLHELIQKEHLRVNVNGSFIETMKIEIQEVLKGEK